MTASSTCYDLLNVFASIRNRGAVSIGQRSSLQQQQFAEFCNRLGIRYWSSLPYNPQSNGKAERCVQTLKYAIDESKADNMNARQYASELCLRYRVTTNATNSNSPA